MKVPKTVGGYEIKSRQQARYFDNELLEKLSKTPWWAPLVLWIPLFGLLVGLTFTETDLGAGSVIGLLAAGLVFWSFAEYWLHRLLFHYTGFGRFHYIIHGAHHEYPHDDARIVFPPTASLILGGIIFGLSLLALGWHVSLPFFAGFVIGYLWYDMTHAWTHIGKPKTRYGRWLKKHHTLHHFSEPDKKFGVSTPLWDFAFGTYGKPAFRKQAAKAKTKAA